MNKSELYRTAGFNPRMIQGILRTWYSEYIRSELKRLSFPFDPDVVSAVLFEVQNRLHDIPSESDLKDLVFDCVRKDVLKAQRNGTIPRVFVNNPLLRETEWSNSSSLKDDMRLDVLLLHLSPKQRIYFMDRYYFLKEPSKEKHRYERTIARLINGKGISSFRFRQLGIPHNHVKPSQYVSYLDRIESYYIGRSSNCSSSLWESPRISCSPWVYILERHYWIASKSIPISCLAILIMILLTCLYFSIAHM